jgi:hypothetical protein
LIGLKEKKRRLGLFNLRRHIECIGLVVVIQDEALTVDKQNDKTIAKMTLLS